LAIPRGAGCFSLGASHFRHRFVRPSALGRTRAGSRYHCSAVAAAELRSRLAAGSRPLRPAGEAARDGARPCQMKPRLGFSSAHRGHLCERLLGAHSSGADPRPGRATTAPPSQRQSSGPAGRRARGRVAPPLLRGRRGGGPVPPGGGPGAASARAGRSGERRRASLPNEATAGLLFRPRGSFVRALAWRP